VIQAAFTCDEWSELKVVQNCVCRNINYVFTWNEIKWVHRVSLRLGFHVVRLREIARCSQNFSFKISLRLEFNSLLINTFLELIVWDNPGREGGSWRICGKKPIGLDNYEVSLESSNQPNLFLYIYLNYYYYYWQKF